MNNDFGTKTLHSSLLPHVNYVATSLGHSHAASADAHCTKNVARRLLIPLVLFIAFSFFFRSIMVRILQQIILADDNVAAAVYNISSMIIRKTYLL